MSRKSGFTIIELVMVIVIIGVISAVGLPKYVNINYKAKINTDSNIISQLSVAIKAKQVENIANGLAPDSSWPDPSTLFNVLNPVPSVGYYYGTEPGMWHVYTGGYSGGDLDYNIYCPHYNGSDKGTIWKYRWDGTGSGHIKGDLWQSFDYGH